ncbi:MAG: bifunctional diaminohydroxyphosphoribosylaminopyrimidine deaminase/5-amino-6-(5-phosphoribosylamino)uracil reductase RibD [Thermoguttaceae bacterium]|nr:bifunctional diaminohydroxyphosphoribosylaminopyrimidine deaminase/5-amino-6-(5-phosphoribosylamino)uracil reductase RibD [Thermoguttaceae bacterium]MDW8039594.1 bifunctional diaminohydroxyphosphoribosylaminopyrimidine deaminase/5-amino-6-(5-phosphoribosylamino)uracil reductase RibD [Thermoguttaceae bacterium]
MDQQQVDRRHMERAIELARLGQGYVEPNPMVGCVIAHGAEVVGEGWHRRYGGDHAEVEALRQAGSRAQGATLYVNLEPCCHWGKTPPCTEAILAAGIRRVVAAMEDPFPQVAGQGLRQLAAAGLQVDCGLLEAEARQLNAPYLKLVQTGRPWVIAKWAMSLDGKLATRTGQSRWISSPESRAVVHQLRGRMDAILIGSRTAAVDDPLLTAQPPGPRTAVRIVMDSRAQLASESQLVQTARQWPVWVAVGPEAAESDCRRLELAGCELLFLPGQTYLDRLLMLLDELGRRRMTNLLVEGGGRVLGTLFDLKEIDEVHIFIAPKLFGGAEAPVPLAGLGIQQLSEAAWVEPFQVQRLGQDVYLSGRVAYQ